MTVFTARTVTDQSVEYPNRFKIDGVSHTIETDFGTVTAAGTNVNKAYLQPIEDALAAALDVEQGNYTGTGAFGSENPNSLTFTRAPKLVIIYAPDLVNSSNYIMFIGQESSSSMVIYRSTTTPGARVQVISWSNYNKTVSWYNTYNDSQQLNLSGATYNYIAFVN